VPSYYDVLGVAPTAPPEEIKRAFRREIAKYHPDKVQHLGEEFQSIAAEKTADLMLAYRTLDDESSRADYDVQLNAGAAPPPGRVRPAPPSPEDDASPRPGTSGRTADEAASKSEPMPSSGRRSVRSPDRTGASDLVRKAAVVRFREAARQQFGECEEPPIEGVDVVCAPPKGGFFSRTVPPRILGRFVAQVDTAAVQESWAIAARARKDDRRDLCVFVMGPAVAPAGELGRAISEQRRRPTQAGGLVIVPVNTRTWTAHVPNDAPPVVRALLSRLQSG